MKGLLGCSSKRSEILGQKASRAFDRRYSQKNLLIFVSSSLQAAASIPVARPGYTIMNRSKHNVSTKDAFRKAARIASPCFLACVLCFAGIIASLLWINKTAGWSFIGVFVFFPAMVICYLADRIMKALVQPPGKLWLYQLLFLTVVLGGCYLAKDL